MEPKLEDDVELCLVDPVRNRFRVYGLTVCRTLFGELCLRIAWGRLGSRRLRERSETFRDEAALEQRRCQLLALRRRHGYEPRRGREGRLPRTPLRAPESSDAAVERAVVEAHGLSLGSADVRKLVGRWYAATRELARYLEERQADAFDLVDVSTLAAMYIGATAAA